MLWQEMLLGSSLSPQGFKACFSEFPDGTIATCAFGAAMQARGCKGTVEPEYEIWAEDAWPWTLEVIAKCPECGEENDLMGIVFQLNDDHKWTRERIALEFVKPLEESLVKPESAVEVEMKGA